MLLDHPFTCKRFPIPCPAPGVYPRTPDHEYHSWNAVSSTLLKECVHSLKHARHFLQNPEEDKFTEALVFGSALHSAILEPETYAKTKVAWPVNPKSKEPYGEKSEAFQEFCRAHHKKCKIVRPEDELAIRRILAELAELPTGRDLLSLPRDNCELAIVWDEPDLGVRCKAKIDLYVPGVAAFDLKSTKDASIFAFGRDSLNLGYTVQAPLYARGIVRAFGLADWPNYFIPALEKEEPFIPAIYHMEPALLEAYWTENEKLIRELVIAIKTNTYTGYVSNVTPLAIPHYGLPIGYEGRRTA